MRTWISLVSAVLAAAIAIVLFASRGGDPTPGRAAPGGTTAAAREARGPRPVPPAHRRWDAGLHRTDTVDFSTRFSGAQAAELRIRGEWRATVVDGEAGTEHAVLRIELAGPAVTMDGQAAPPELHAELARPWFVELDAAGRVEAAWFPRGVGRASRDLLKTVAAYLQYCAPDGAACDRVEQDATGTYQAAYAVDARGSEITRTKERYVSITTTAGPAAPADVGGPIVAASAARFELDAEGWPVRVAIDERLEVALSEAEGRYAAAVSLRAERTGAGLRADLVGAFTAARAELVRVSPLAEPPDARDDGEAHDRQLLAGADHGQLMDALRAARDPHDEVAVQRRLRALFALHPDEAQRAAEALRGTSLSATGKQTVMAALGGAGTPEAQRALVDALSRERAPELRQQALAVLGLTPSPTDATRAALRALIDAPVDPADRDTALLAFGSASRGAEDSVAWLLERLAQAQAPADEARYLRALANTADPRALPAITERLRAPDAALRAAAVAALRLIEEPTVDGLISRVLASDADAAVRGEAVFAAQFRPLERVLPGLRVAAERDPAAPVRMRIVELLGQRRGESPACAPLLAWIAQHDRDAEVRDTAAQLLGA